MSIGNFNNDYIHTCSCNYILNHTLPALATYNNYINKYEDDVTVRDCICTCI